MTFGPRLEIASIIPTYEKSVQPVSYEEKMSVTEKQTLGFQSEVKQFCN